MTYRGVVRGGAVVLEPGADLPEGAEVQVEAGSPSPTLELLGEPSLEDALEKLYFLYKVRRGLDQADAGETVSHQDARERLAQWLG